MLFGNENHRNKDHRIRGKTITWEIHNNVPDKYGNIYPPRDKIEMVVSDSANSNWELTIDIVDKVIAPAIEAEDKSRQNSILCDDFKGHIKKKVKENIMLNK